MVEQSRIRNFSIIAHIDHGKSTLADRLIQFCGGLCAREMKDQVLDSMDIERERGITIKAQTTRLKYQHDDGQEYYINLIDTPGHVDFTYEVSRSLAACEGAVLVVDATQGVEAQTLANVYLSLEHDHEIIPILNKIDLPAAEPDMIKQQITDVIGLDGSTAIPASGKSGIGIKNILDAVVAQIPPPMGETDSPLQAMIIDSWYDAYLGVFVLFRVVNGKIKRGDKIKLMNAGVEYYAEQLGVFTPKKEYCDELSAGEVGFFTGQIKAVRDCKIGDTITLSKKPCLEPLEGFKPVIPVVFCGLYPSDASQFNDLRDSLDRLALNDASLQYETESSPALGFGFRCGFLGLLHLEIIQERLDREFNIDLIATAPSVVYEITLRNGQDISLHNPIDFPDVTHIEEIREPWIRATIMIPDEFVGAVLQLCTERRGEQKELTYVGSRAMAIYDLPLNEVIFDFYDRLKSISRGYASFDYELAGYRSGDLVKIQILINSDPVDALAMVVHRSQSEIRGRAICTKLKDLIPRQLYKVAIQAAIGGKIIARETIGALRKDVTAKCYGGDITRKRKLLEKQKAGKKRMQQIGKIDVPKSAFLAALKI